MCWLRNARSPTAMQKVAFNSPPTASTVGPPSRSGTGSGVYPRDRRIGYTSPSKTRTTESSHGVTISRSWSKTASADGASEPTPSFAVTIGSPPALPEVITSGRSPSNRWCSGVYGSINPRQLLPGATVGDSGRASTDSRWRSRTIDRPGPDGTCSSSASSSAYRRTTATDAAMRANGLSPRSFPARGRRTAASSVASQVRWNPPTPFTATTDPAASAARVRSIASAPPTPSPPQRNQTFGPQAGQAAV